MDAALKQSFESTLRWEHPSPDRLRLNAYLFFAAFLCSVGVGLSSSLKGRRKIAYTACYIHLIAATSYFLMSNNLVPMILTTKGRPLLVTRLFEWMVTVPMLLRLVSWLIDPDAGRLETLLQRQFVCLMTGGVGPLLSFPFNWVSFSYSCYLQVLVLITLHQYFSSMKRKLHSSYDRLLITALHWAILSIFTVYTFFWLFAVELNLIPLATETFVYANLDITTKLLLTSVLSNLTGAAYDYDFVEFPRYFKDFTSAIGVPVFGVSRDGTVVCWNVSMESTTGRAAGTVLFEKVDRCGAFTPEGVQAIREAMGRPPTKPTAETAPTTTAQIGIKGNGNPQESRTPFYVLCNETEADSLPQIFFIEASANAAAAHQAFAELTRRLAAGTEEMAKSHRAASGKPGASLGSRLT